MVIKIKMANNTTSQNKQEELEKERHQRDVEAFRMGISIAHNTYSSMMNRYKRTRDPAARYILLVDKLCFLTDIGFGIFKSQTEKYQQDLHEDYQKVDEMIQGMQDELGNLIDWIQNPVYGPDHPVGNRMMADAEQTFVGKANVKPAF